MIYRAWEERAESWDGLGFSPSMLGSGCDRALWYQFRWAAAKEVFSGRMLRLFQTGHIEEQRIIDDLLMIGLDLDPVDPATGRQFNARALAGHVRGKLDGIINSGVPEAPAKRHVLEAKSHGLKSWAKLVAAGAGNLREGKFDHWVQCQVYMHVWGIDRALYSATCKDTDERWNDRVRLDHEFCVKLIARLERIARSDSPPPPISEKRNAPDCRFCKAKPLCVGESFSRVNCRTCIHSTAEFHGDAAWSCARWAKPLLADEQRRGCANHLLIPALVPGEQTDADEAAETISYVLTDGRLWVDGQDVSPAPIENPEKEPAA
jgi:hypothetical protein